MTRVIRWLITLPEEWRFYRGQESLRRIRYGDICVSWLRSLQLSLVCQRFVPALYLCQVPHIPYGNTTTLLPISFRYSSIAVLAISNVGFFASFSDDACHSFYLLSPAFKGLCNSFSLRLRNRQ